MNNYQKIKEFLSQSNLSTEQSDELLILFGKSDDKELLSVVKLLFEDVSWSEKIYNNYYEKKNAIKNNDNATIEKIFRNEISLIQNL